MSFICSTFEEYLAVVKDEIRIKHPYYRGQLKRISEGYTLQPSIGRYPKYSTCTLQEMYHIEREMLNTFTNHLCEISGLDTLKASEFLKRWTKQQLLEKVGKSKKKMVYRKPSTKQFGREGLLGRLF